MARRQRLLLCLLLAALSAAPRSRAHGDSVSTLHLTLEPTALRASLTLDFRDLSLWVYPGPPDYPAAVLAAMRQARDELLWLSYDAGPRVAPSDFAASIPAPGSVRIDFTYPPPPPGAATIDLRTLHVDRLPIGHHQFLTVEDARRADAGALIAEESLDVDQDAASIDIPRVSAPARLRLAASPLAPKPQAQAAGNAPGPAPKSLATARSTAPLLWILSTFALLILAVFIVHAVKHSPSVSAQRGRTP